VDATAGTTGPGIPAGSNADQVFIETENWDYSATPPYDVGLYFVNTAPFGSSDVLSVDPNLATGTTSVTNAGTLIVWDWLHSSTNSVAATAFVNASLTNSGTTEDFHSIDRVFDRKTGTTSRNKSQGKRAVDPTGSMGATVVDAAGNTYTIVPAGTSPTYSYFQNVKSGSRTVTH
jgi:hypothetical protein